MKRSMDLDVLRCPRCGGTKRVIARIEEPDVVERILRAMGLWTEPPLPRARAGPPPPDLFDVDHLG